MPDSTPSLQTEFQELLLVALGAVPGAVVRWQASVHLQDQNVLVNVAGAAVLGLMVGRTLRPRWQLLIGVGFCGSLTTFSSWMLDAMRQISQGDWVQAIGLIGLTLGLGVGAALIGYLLGQRLKS